MLTTRKLMSNFDINNVILIGIVLIAFILRIFKLDEAPPSLYFDEVTNVYYPFLNSIGVITLSLRSVIVYFLGGNFFLYSISGPSTFYMRLPVIIYGTLVIILTYFLGKEMFSKSVAILASVIMAITPWAFHFSRYNIPSMSYVFYFMTTLYFFYKSFNATNLAREIYFIAACFIIGLTFNTHIMSINFIPLFLIGYILLYRNKFRKIRNKIVSFGAFLLAFSPTLYSVILRFGPQRGVETVFVRYSTFSQAKGLFDFIQMILTRMYYHLSPDFLIFTGGASFIGDHASPMISNIILLHYSTSKMGVLGYLGIIAYLGLFFFLYRLNKKQAKTEEKLLLYWIIIYALASGVAYYDNPNAARNIMGLPAFVLTIAVFLDKVIHRLHHHANKNINKSIKNRYKILLIIVIGFLIVGQTAIYLNDYYASYPTRAAKNFNYGYKNTADFLTEKQLWYNNIFIYAIDPEWYGDRVLSFYSPNQPTTNIIRVTDVDKSVTAIRQKGIGTLYITSFPDDVTKLEKYGLILNIKGQIEYPDDSLAFLILELVLIKKPPIPPHPIWK